MCTLHVEVRAPCFPQPFSILESIPAQVAGSEPGEAPPLTPQSILGLHTALPDFRVIVRDQT